MMALTHVKKKRLRYGSTFQAANINYINYDYMALDTLLGWRDDGDAWQPGRVQHILCKTSPIGLIVTPRVRIPYEDRLFHRIYL